MLIIPKNKLEADFPDFLSRNHDSNFMKFTKTLTKSINDLLSVQKKNQDYFSLNKKLQVWKEQKQAYKYQMCFKADYKIKNVRIFKNDILLHVEEDIDNFFFTINEKSDTIAPDLNIKYQMIVTLQNDEVLMKGFPENATVMKNSFDKDAGLDSIGKLVDCPRRVYKTNLKPEDYQNTEPPFCNLPIESDHDYLLRLKEYVRRYWREPLVCLKIWQYYNLNSHLVNRSEKLCTIGESYIGEGYIGTKENYNAHCYDLVIDSGERVPSNLQFSNMSEIQKLVDKYSPLSKRVFIEYNDIVCDIAENILVTTNLMSDISVVPDEYVVNIYIMSNEGVSVPAEIFVDLDKKITNNEGFGSIKLSEGHHTVVVYPNEDYLHKVTDIWVSEDMNVNITVDNEPPKRFEIKCSVIDSLTRNPVQATGYYDDESNIIESDENGHFDVVWEKGKHVVVLRADKYKEQRFEVETKGSGGVVFDLKHDEYTVSFVVADSETSIPITAAKIRIDNLPNEIITNNEGKVSVPLRSGNHNFIVNADNYEEYRVDVEVNKDEIIDIKLKSLVEVKIPVTVHIVDETTKDPIGAGLMIIDTNIYVSFDKGEAVVSLKKGIHSFTVAAENYKEIYALKEVQYPPKDITLELKKIGEK